MLLKNMKLLCAAMFAAGAMALSAAVPAMVLEYDYNDNGSISSRTINGAVQKFEYDKRGQLLSVKDKSGNFVERYTYDKAGNILEKEINGKLTKFTYDKANQLVSKVDADGKVTNYSYDAAGRLVKEGDKEYKYSYLDKLVEVTENGKPVANFDYYVDGQIATATQNGVTENFVWDGLALVARNTTSYVNEPAITGGNPILANNKVLFNDMLGSTLGINDGNRVESINRTAFGESASTSNDQFFTGKPQIGELGYAFLFRNYRADNGKWQTADPMGYPDGWNQLAYCNNGVTDAIDWLGGVGIKWGPGVDSGEPTTPTSVTGSINTFFNAQGHPTYGTQTNVHYEWVPLVDNTYVNTSSSSVTKSVSITNIVTHSTSSFNSSISTFSNQVGATISSTLGNNLSPGTITGAINTVTGQINQNSTSMTYCNSATNQSTATNQVAVGAMEKVRYMYYQLFAVIEVCIVQYTGIAIPGAPAGTFFWQPNVISTSTSGQYGLTQKHEREIRYNAE